jgi:hypothetical protein
MSDEPSDVTLDRRLRSADPLAPGALPSEADTDAVLKRLLATGPDGGRSRSVRRRRLPWLAGATAAAAALAVALVLLLGSSATSPAFAVTRNPNGTITVRLIRVAGIAGVNHKLAALGVRARIVSLDMAAYVASLHPCQGKPTGMLRTITINPAAIPHRQVILLAADRLARLHYLSVVRARDANAAVRALRNARALRDARALAASPTIANRTLQIYCVNAISLARGLIKQRVR